MSNNKSGRATAASRAKPATLDDVHEELRIANRLMIARLALAGLTQAEIGALIEKDQSGVSRMFPNGLLSRLAKLSGAAIRD